MNKFKKILIGTLSGAIMLTATVMQVNAINPAWQLNPATMYSIDFVCTAVCSGTHNHTMDVTAFNTTTGDFTATGFYTSLPQYSWTGNGNISDSTMTMTIVYDVGSPLPGYTVTMSGAISDGDMSGTATSTNGETFNWTITPQAGPLTSPITPTPTTNPFAVPTACMGNGTYGAPIVGTNGSNNINGTSGDDLIFALGGSDTVNGGGGNDCIVGGAGSDSLRGGNGMDVILGEGGSDSLDGGNHEDDLYGGEGADNLNGGNDSDELWGDAGTDSLNGGNGDDTLKGGTGNDALRGDNGKDNLDGELGNDSANGGTGNQDTCTAESQSACEL